MAGTQDSENLSTWRTRIATMAREQPDCRFTSLNQHLNLEALRTAYFQLRKSAKPGIDGVTWHEDGNDLEASRRGINTTTPVWLAAADCQHAAPASDFCRFSGRCRHLLAQRAGGSGGPPFGL